MPFFPGTDRQKTYFPETNVPTLFNKPARLHERFIYMQKILQFCLFSIILNNDMYYKEFRHKSYTKTQFFNNKFKIISTQLIQKDFCLIRNNSDFLKHMF